LFLNRHPSVATYAETTSLFWDQVAASQWVEQAGKGGKRKAGLLALVITSAPPLSCHTEYLGWCTWIFSGGALGITLARRPTFRLPPFPACSTHWDAFATRSQKSDVVSA